LVGFGGAAGQHVCAVARVLGVRDVLLHPLAGLLSAYGMGLADVSWDGQRDAGRVTLPADSDPLPEEVAAALSQLEQQGRAALVGEGADAGSLEPQRLLDLRYAGTDSPLSIVASAAGWRAAFEDQHQRRFGYTRAGRPIEIVTARVRVRAPASAGDELGRLALERARSLRGAAPGPPEPIRSEAVFFPGQGRVPVPVYDREALAAASRLTGPALILEDTGTVALDPGFTLRCDDNGVLHLRDEAPLRRAQAAGESLQEDLATARARLEPPDPVRLEVFGNRFMSCAEQMGAVLRNTSVSTNIKERLDYSCAVFDADGGLVANAPHIPVHLGAMSETVRAVLRRFPDLASGDAVVSNDPFEGGSHLPDVTVVTPVFVGDGPAPDFFVASRGHHADIGGSTPGSMPPDSHSLEEEGVLLEAFRLVSRGHFEE
jgi:5-oxoprolinase (ATP-hydrolysing)